MKTRSTTDPIVTPDTPTIFCDAALRVFEREGLAGFNVHAVVRESGKSLGSLYHHFQSFDGLAAALYMRCMADLLDALIEAIVRRRTARAGVEAFAVAYLQFTKDEPMKALFIHAAPAASYLPVHAEAIAQSKAPRIAKLLAWIAPHVRAKSVVDVPPALLEMLLVGPLAETARRWLANAAGVDIDEAMKILPSRIWHSVARAQAPQ